MAWRGNISKSLKELRILLCQSSPASASTRFLSIFLLSSFDQTKICEIGEFDRPFLGFSIVYEGGFDSFQDVRGEELQRFEDSEP